MEGLQKGARREDCVRVCGVASSASISLPLAACENHSSTAPTSSALLKHEANNIPNLDTNREQPRAAASKGAS